jgi:hypothetical protein
MAIEEITPDLVATMAGQIEAVGNAKEHERDVQALGTGLITPTEFSRREFSRSAGTRSTTCNSWS